MSKRLIPFPLVLVAITGTFVLVALYADVRGRERQAMHEEEPTVETVNAPAVAAPMPEPAATSTPEETPAEPQRLRLMSDAPGEGGAASVAVYDCWRFEIRDGRGIVDRTYGSGIVGPETMHMRCHWTSNAFQTTDGMTSVILLDANRTATEGLGDGSRKTLWKADPYSGELSELPLPEGTDRNVFIIGTDADESVLYLSSTTAPGQLVIVPLSGDTARIFNYAQLDTETLALNGDGSRAIGFERTADGTVYFHRINVSTGQRVRVRSLSMGSGVLLPVDERRMLFLAEDRGTYVLDIFTGATKSVPKRFIDVAGVSIDGQSVLLSGPDVPLTAIPVSELPKP